MKIKLAVLCLLILSTSCNKQLTSLVIEKDNIDSNNNIYQPGSVFIYDYEIIKDKKPLKLATNRGMFAYSEFKLTPAKSDNVEVDNIHLIVQPVSNGNRTNKNQTEIAYIQGPAFSSMSSTGAVENESNVWIHPIRVGFFRSLETAPFPYIKYPLVIGKKWNDQMKIGENWSDELWGTWQGNLSLAYDFEITDKKKLLTDLGEIECYVVSSSAKSDMGVTNLTSYFSEEFGFVRLEYRLLNNLRVNMWLIDHKKEQQFNDLETFSRTKKYLKN